MVAVVWHLTHLESQYSHLFVEELPYMPVGQSVASKMHWLVIKKYPGAHVWQLMLVPTQVRQNDEQDKQRLF